MWTALITQPPTRSATNRWRVPTKGPPVTAGEGELRASGGGLIRTTGRPSEDTAYEVADKILRGLQKSFEATKSFPKKPSGSLIKRSYSASAWWTGQLTPERRYHAELAGIHRARGGLLAPPKPEPEPEPEPVPANIPTWARQSTYVDHKGRLIFIGGDLDCRYEDFEVEERQMPRLRGRMPYNVDGITSMARNEHVRFLPGAFADSLDGEILALVGGDYDNPLGGTAQRSLNFADTEDALEFRTGRIPETSVNRDFVTKLRGGFVRGVTAGWALLGSDTTTEAIPGGGTRIVVKKAMLCELRFRTRSAFAGESIQASRRNEHRLLVV